MASIPATIFFDEGPGFVYLRELGSGESGTAYLVRCIADQKLYVRKESLSTIPCTDSCGNQLDAMKCLPVKDVDQVARLCGIQVYKHNQQNKAYEVSYWSFYDSGSVFDVHKRSQKLVVGLPDKWLGKWLYDMLGVLAEIHQKGVGHGDTHHANWLLRRDNDTDIPQVGLCDWGGMSQHRVGKSADAFGTICAFDYINLFKWCVRWPFFNTKTSANFRTLYEHYNRDAARYMQTRDHASFIGGMKAIREEAHQLFVNAPTPSAREKELVKCRSEEMSIRILQSSAFNMTPTKSLKHFTVVEVDAKSKKLTIRSRSSGVKLDFHKHEAKSFEQCQTSDAWEVVRS